MDTELKCVACDVIRAVIQVTPVARGYEMRSLECPQCGSLFKLVLRNPRRRATSHVNESATGILN
jgi:hypothetical protein